MNKYNFYFSAYDLPYEDETDEILKETFLEKDVHNLQITSEKFNLRCLQGISKESKTFFNEKQMFEITTIELPLLKKDPTLNQKLLEHIEKIYTVMIQEGHCFMKLEPVLTKII